MLKYHDAKVGRPNVAELKELLGPMLVLSSESAERFEGVFDKLLACLNVQDIVEGLLIRDYAKRTGRPAATTGCVPCPSSAASSRASISRSNA